MLVRVHYSLISVGTELAPLKASLVPTADNASTVEKGAAYASLANRYFKASLRDPEKAARRLASIARRQMAKMRPAPDADAQQAGRAWRHQLVEGRRRIRRVEGRQAANRDRRFSGQLSVELAGDHDSGGNGSGGSPAGHRARRRDLDRHPQRIEGSLAGLAELRSRPPRGLPDLRSR